MTKRIFICLALLPALAGCSPELPGVISRPSTRTPFFAAIGATAYLLYKDNWTLEETQTGNDRFSIVLKKNTIRPDGDSEAGYLFKRRAMEIATAQGFDNYRILEYSEGIESASLGPQRVAQGVIQCYREAAAGK